MDKLQLQSDFKDFYDDFFDSEGEVLERNKASEPSRKSLYKILASHKLIPAVTGKVAKFRKKLPWDAPVIVFTDTERHDGGEKMMMSYKEAFKEHAEKMMSTYIVNKGQIGISYRYVRIGDAIFFFKLKSEGWNSNNNAKVLEKERVAEEDALKFTPFDVPLYSIDFVPATDRTGKEWMFAVDLNFAPTLAGIELEEMVSPEEIVDLLKIWYKENR